MSDTSLRNRKRARQIAWIIGILVIISAIIIAVIHHLFQPPVLRYITHNGQPQSTQNAEKFNEIKIGTSRKKVLRTFGEPGVTVMTSEDEESNNVSGDVYLTLDEKEIIIYYDTRNRVTEISTIVEIITEDD